MIERLEGETLGQATVGHGGLWAILSERRWDRPVISHEKTFPPEIFFLIICVRQSVTVPRIFSGTGTGTFFRDQIFPVPVLFSGTN